ncbi:MAG TPA: SgcJ/EcaC family oxidoreductase [Herpetosiphonaceae bacterium]
MSDLQAARPSRDEDRRAISGLLDRLAEAWAAGDAEAYASHFTPDAEYVVFDGSRHSGRQAIADCHRPLFERFLKGSRLASVDSSIRFLGPDVAAVHSRGAVLKAGQGQPTRRRLSVQTTIVVRQAGDWAIAAFQNTRYRPFGETLLGRLLARLGGAPKPQPADSRR